MLKVYYPFSYLPDSSATEFLLELCCPVCQMLASFQTKINYRTGFRPGDLYL